MRRLLVLVVLLFVVAMPGYAQEQTIAEIVVASASAENPEFTTLLTAVQAADPSVLNALSDPASTLTVFAPTDAAFAALASSLGQSTFNSILADPVALTEILFYHVISGNITSGSVVAGIQNSNGGFGVRTLSGQLIDVRGTLNEEGAIDLSAGITIDNANLVLESIDIPASNGVIHVIDAVMVPSLDTIADVVVSSTRGSDSQFNLLLAAVQAADSSVLAALSDRTASLTVFAPTDAAFEALGADTLNAVLADQGLLTTILTYHVYNGVVYSSTLPSSLQMLSGDTANIALRDGGVFIDNAQILVTDIETMNGVIHVIDAVILP
ncbi:MAG: fasciclin domain-containing protein [Anaerolineae bacterium]